MQKIRFAPLAILSLSIGLMTACDSTSANGKAPTVSSPVYISGVQTGPTDVTNTLDNVTVYHLTGTVTDVKSWSWTVLSGSTVVETLVEPSPAGDGDTKLGNTYTMVTFTPKASWGPTGTYTLRGVLTGTDGSTQTTVNITFKAAPGGSTGTNLTDGGAVDLGAQLASAGSFLSIEGAWSITSGQKSAADEDSIDVIFFATPSSSSGTPTFFSPAAAYSASLGNLGGWSVRHNTIIVSSPNALSTVEQVMALTDGSSSHSAAATSGGWYAVKLDSGKYGSIHVTSLSGSGNAATATVEVFN